MTKRILDKFLSEKGGIDDIITFTAFFLILFTLIFGSFTYYNIVMGAENTIYKVGRIVSTQDFCTNESIRSFAEASEFDPYDFYVITVTDAGEFSTSQLVKNSKTSASSGSITVLCPDTFKKGTTFKVALTQKGTVIQTFDVFSNKYSKVQTFVKD